MGVGGSCGYTAELTGYLVTQERSCQPDYLVRLIGLIRTGSGLGCDLH